ncbi:MAG: hypothetical protein AAGF95_19485 [Chloroflexota bacterium]
MNETHASTTDHHKPELVEIRVKGHLDNRWANWFEGMTITLEDNGSTLLTGPVVDQAALHGLLKKVRDLGIALVSVNCAKSSGANAANSTLQDKTSSYNGG